MKSRQGRGWGGAGVPASEVLAGILDRHGVARELREHRILARWRDLVGEQLGDRTFPDGLERGLLWVRVTNSSWVQELSFVRDELVERINGMLGDPPLVREIRFHIGPRERVADEDALAPTVRIRRQAPRLRHPPPPASGERLASIERESAGVEDRELRDAILELRKRWDI